MVIAEAVIERLAEFPFKMSPNEIAVLDQQVAIHHIRRLVLWHGIKVRNRAVEIDPKHL